MADKALSPEIIKLMDKIAKNPTSRLFVPLAEEYLKSDMLDEAIFFLVDGIKNHPNYVAARVMLGKIYLQKKQITEAKNEFEQVILVSPENIFAGKKLAVIYQGEGEVQKAVDICKKILMTDPSDKETKALLSSLEKERVARPVSSPIEAPPEFHSGTTAGDAVLSPAGERLFDPQGETPLPERGTEEQKSLETDPSFEREPPMAPLSMVPPSDQEALISPSLPAENIEGRESFPLLSSDENKEDPEANVEAPPAMESNDNRGLSGWEDPLAVLAPSSPLPESSPEPELNEELATTTLASLYMDQGYFQEAVDVYRKILARNPSDDESLKGLESALKKLTGPAASQPPPSGSENSRGRQSQGKTQRLQSWLDSIRKDEGE